MRLLFGLGGLSHDLVVSDTLVLMCFVLPIFFTPHFFVFRSDLTMLFALLHDFICLYFANVIRRCVFLVRIVPLLDSELMKELLLILQFPILVNAHSCIG